MKSPAGDGVRLAAVQTALADLERGLVRDRCHVVVSVPPGPARNLLLTALAQRLAPALRVVRLPETDTAEGELCAAILRELGEAPGDDAEASLLGVARRLAQRGSALALVAGDARALPIPALRRLGRLAAQARPGLRLVLVSPAEPGSGRDAIAEIMAPLGIGAVKVVLEGVSEHGGAATLPAPPRAPVPQPAAARPRPMARARIRVAAESGRGVPPVLWRAAGLIAIAALGLVALERIDFSPPPQAATQEPGAAVAVASQPKLPVVTPAEPREVTLAHEAPRAPETPAASASTPAPTPAPSAPVPVPATPRPAPTPKSAPAPEPTPVPAPVAVAANPALPQVVAPPTVVAEVAPAEIALPAPPTAIAPPAAPAPEAPTLGPVTAVEPEPAPPAPMIRVSLNADPWAHIQVDGRDVGTTPMSDLALTPGPHRFRVRFPDGRVIERTVRIDAVRDHIRFP